MSIYYILWSIITILCFCEVKFYKNTKSNIKTAVGFILLIIFVFIAGLKGNVGSDYLNYQEKYLYVAEHPSYDWVRAIEPGWWYWTLLLSNLGLSFAGAWFITTLINISIKTYVFEKLSPLISLSFAIYLVGLFFERDFDGIRQGFSLSFAYISVIYWIKQDKLKYILFLGIAVSLHFTSIIFALIPLLDRQWSNRFIYISIFIGLILMVTINLPAIISNSNLGYGNMIFSKLMIYSNAEQYNSAMGLSIGIMFRLLVLFVFININQNFYTVREYNILKNGFSLAVFFSLAFNSFDILGSRLFYGFREFQIFIIPVIITSLKTNIARSLGVIGILLYCLVLLCRLFQSNMAQYYNYKMILQ